MPIRISDQPPPRRYKHTLRKSPYLVSLIFLLAATAFSLLNIYVPDLIYVTVREPGPTVFETQYGLYQRCTRVSSPLDYHFLAPSQPIFDRLNDYEETKLFREHRSGLRNDTGVGEWECQPFPSRSECQAFGERFCVLWSTSGYLAQLSLVPCLIALFSLLFIFLHRGQRTARAKARRQQWKLVTVTMIIHFLFQGIELGIIFYVFRTDERFNTRYTRLDKSWTFGVLSAILSLFISALLSYTGTAAQQGKPWAAGKSARKARRHRRTRSGRVIAVPEGTAIPPEEVVTVGEVEAARAVEEGRADERTGLLAAYGQEGR